MDETRPESRPEGRPKRRRSRVEQIALDHDLPPYEPKVGDIVVTYHLFKDPEEIKADFADAKSRGIDPETYLANSREPIAKFRPCIVMAMKNNRAVLVPISSRADPRGRHMALHEPEELRAAGLDDHKPAYAKVLEAAQYDLPHPMILPVRGDDGQPTWTAGKTTTEMRRQTAMEMVRQKKQGRLTSLKDRSAATIPGVLVNEMNRAISEAQSRRTTRGTRSANPDQLSVEQEASTISSSEVDRRRAALLAYQREERARAAAEALARRKGEHPEQVDPLKAKAEALARRRGTHPDQRAPHDLPRDRADQRG